MKRTVLFIISLFSIIAIFAQAKDVYISVAIPNNSVLDSNIRAILKNKIVTIASTNGVAATECGAIAIIPEINVIEENKIEGGMRNIFSTQLELSLSTRNIITNTVFNSVQLSYRGDGYSVEEARRSAIKKISTTDARFSSFINETKAKICDYYANNASSLISKANTLASQQLYDEALALLSTFPESLPDYVNVSETIVRIYNMCQSLYCDQIMLSAQAAYSKRDYESALAIATSINPQSSCVKESKRLIAQIKKNLDDEHAAKIAMEKEMIEVEKERIRSGERIERERIHSEERKNACMINAVRDIASAYYKRQTSYIFF